MDEQPLASYLTLPVSFPSTNLSSHLQFLQEIFRAVEANKGDLQVAAQVVARLLRANLNSLDDDFASVLSQSAEAIPLPSLELAQIGNIAVTFSILSDQVINLQQGNRASNVEIAIAGYEVATNFFDHPAFSEEAWARALNSLGIAYLERIRGERAENVEIAIEYFLNVSEVCTDPDFSQSWAVAQLELGNAYIERIRGNRVDNLERAIKFFRSALEVFTHSAFPEEWATTHNNLGAAFTDRILGEKAENLEESIRCLKAALKVRTLEVRPQEWAETKNNLGIAYRKRIRRRRADNLEKAISCYKAALEVHDRNNFPRRWAETQSNLGIVYAERIRESRADNLEAAISCFKAALVVHTYQNFPQSWANLQYCLGNTYILRIKGERAKNLEEALSFFKESLKIYTREAFPNNWAMVQNRMGWTYFNRVKEKKIDNLNLAICCYQAALQIYACRGFSTQYAGTQGNLGLCYQDAQQLSNAYDAFRVAIDTVEAIRDEINSSSAIVKNIGESIHKHSIEWYHLYQSMVKVCLELGYNDQVIEYAERSKTRVLVELLLAGGFKRIFPPEIVDQLEQLRGEIAIGQYQLQTATADNPADLFQRVLQLRQQRNELQNRYLQIGYGFKLDSFRSILEDYSAVIEWYILGGTFLTFIITKQATPIILQSELDDLQALNDWLDEYLRVYNQPLKKSWGDSLTSRLHQLAKILHLEDILRHLPDTCHQIILIPHRFLHTLPLHALPLPNQKDKCLLEKFSRGQDLRNWHSANAII